MGLSFKKLMELEPELKRLYDEAQEISKNKHKYMEVGSGNEKFFCACKYWYGAEDVIGLKPQLIKLVGWGRKNQKNHDILATDTAYDIAYDRIFQQLPDCTHESYMCYY